MLAAESAHPSPPLLRLLPQDPLEAAEGSMERLTTGEHHPDGPALPLTVAPTMR
jgi:hypothetical protein